MHAFKKVYKVLLLIIEISSDAVLHTIIFHLASNNQMFTLSEPAVLHSQYSNYYTSSPIVKNAAAQTTNTYS